MARIPLFTTKEGLPPEAHHIFDAIAQSRGWIAGPFALMLNSPHVAGRVAHLGAYLRFESVLSLEERELATLTAAREIDCDYEWSLHVDLARQAGVREEAIEVIGSRGSIDLLTDHEALIVRYGRELIPSHHVSAETFEAARRAFGDQGVLDLTVTMGYYTMLAFALNAFEVEPAPETPRLP